MSTTRDLLGAGRVVLAVGWSASDASEASLVGTSLVVPGGGCRLVCACSLPRDPCVVESETLTTAAGASKCVCSAAAALLCGECLKVDASLCWLVVCEG